MEKVIIAANIYENEPDRLREQARLLCSEGVSMLHLHLRHNGSSISNRELRDDDAEGGSERKLQIYGSSIGNIRGIRDNSDTVSKSGTGAEKDIRVVGRDNVVKDIGTAGDDSGIITIGDRLSISERFRSAADAIYRECPEIIIIPEADDTYDSLEAYVSDAMCIIESEPKMAMIPFDALDGLRSDGVKNRLCRIPSQSQTLEGLSTDSVKNLNGLFQAEAREEAMRKLGYAMLDNGVRPLIRVSDVSMLDTALRMYREDWLTPPLSLMFELGQRGRMDAVLDNLKFLVSRLPEHSNWSVQSHGENSSTNSIDMAAAAVLYGGSICIGDENDTMDELMQKLTQITALVRALQREPARPADARSILGLNIKYRREIEAHML